MDREEAIKVIEEFNNAGGSIFIDNCNGHMPDGDLIMLAKDCQKLLAQHKKDIEG